MALVLTASVSVTVPHAEAATRPGPVTALKQQLNGHGGVRQSSVYRTVWGPEEGSQQQQPISGRLQVRDALVFPDDD
jgi:hypothetical protein